MTPVRRCFGPIVVGCVAALLGLGMTRVRAADLPATVTLESGWQLQDFAKVDQAGAALAQPGFVPRGWHRATVPGTVLTTLVNNGVYPEPLYGENNRPERIPESLCRTAYWYRTEVGVPATYAGRRIWLNFEGINYTAEVWVNAHRVGVIRGAFSRGIFDVTSLVQPGAPAAVAVLIQPPPHPATPHEQTLSAGTGPNGGEFSQDGATFICTQGWDWIPGIRDRDMGIWQKVTLSASGPVRIENPLVVSHLPLPRTDSADVTIEATLRNVGEATEQVSLRGAFAGVDVSTTVTLAPHASQRVTFAPATNPALHLDRPRLWWPNGYGEPNLYALRLEASTAGTLSDVHSLNFGIREISYQVPDSDNLTISVNGVPVLCRGGDWGMDEAMKRIPRSRLEAQIRFHQLARCNMIRNWVGQSTGEDFYDLCDRYGIMVWDEFFEPNPSDSGRKDPEDGSEDVRDIPMYLANVREKVLRFRNHPSIALWCGRNEGDPAPAAVAEGLEQVMKALEPARLYHPNSADGRGVRSGGPYYWRTPREYFLPPVTRRGVPIPPSPENLEPFKTELGSVSVPTLEAIQAMMPEKDWNTINDDWAEHDLCAGAQAGDRYVVMLTQRYGPWKGLVEFARASQLACFESHQAMFEGRYARLFAPCTGVLAWMSNPSQPSFVWQFYSYDLEPIAALYAVRKASESVHVQLNRNDDHLAVINHTPAALSEMTARVRVIALDGKTLSDRSVHVAVPPSTARDLGEVEYPAGTPQVHFVKVELRDSDGRLVSENFYWRAPKSAPEDYRALQTLPTAKLNLSAVRRDRDGKCLIEVTLVNRSETIALQAHLQLRRQRSGERVLPVYYDDNYTSLLPGESRVITIEAAVEHLRGEPPLIVLDGWNVTTAATAGEVAIAPNTAALVGPKS
jgi:beta-galactosidase/beta-glucuronidase